MKTEYTEILNSDPLDFYPEMTETFYSIPLEMKSLVRVLELLYDNKEYSIHRDILSFLNEEYNNDFPILFPQKQ
jgi:hypothetical protein